MTLLVGCSFKTEIRGCPLTCELSARISEEESCFGQASNETEQHYCYMALLNCAF